jgi:hypothetical protein
MSKKVIYVLPFTEVNRGWYEIEADSLEEAKAIAVDGSFTEDHEPFYKDGHTEWDPEEIEIEEVTE